MHYEGEIEATAYREDKDHSEREIRMLRDELERMGQAADASDPAPP